jgi:hypothetical protein
LRSVLVWVGSQFLLLWCAVDIRLRSAELSTVLIQGQVDLLIEHVSVCQQIPDIGRRGSEPCRMLELFDRLTRFSGN